MSQQLLIKFCFNSEVYKTHQTLNLYKNIQKVYDSYINLIDKF